MCVVQRVRAIFERVAPSLDRGLPKIGGVLLLIAAGFAVHSWRFAHVRNRATATVTENISTFAKGGGILYYPKLRFRTATGEIVQVLADNGTEDIDFSAGETVPVLYTSDDPQGAIIATAWRAYHAAIIFGLLGTALFDLGWLLRVRQRKQASASSSS